MIKKIKELLSKYGITFTTNSYIDSIVVEVDLKRLNDNPINYNEDASWEIIEGAYCTCLQDDPNWHFFYENTYNIIRCSMKNINPLLEYLEECGVTYKYNGTWIDGSSTVRGHREEFQQMFHAFSMIAIKGYNWRNITYMFDRVAHCFLNHQAFRIKPYRTMFGTMWEPMLVGENANRRAHYIGEIFGAKAMREKFEDRIKVYEEESKKGLAEVEALKEEHERIKEMMGVDFDEEDTADDEPEELVARSADSG